MRRFWIASVSALLLGLAAAGAAANWKQDYQAAKGKCKAGQYADAIPLLQKALRDKPRSCVGCIRTGMFFEDYFPLYYLGQALMETGRSEEAGDCYDRLEAEGLIQKSKELAGPFEMAVQGARALNKAASPAAPAGAVPPPTKPKPEPESPPPPVRTESAAPLPPPAPPFKPSESTPDPEAVQGVRRKLDAAERQLDAVDPADLRNHPRLFKHYQGLKETLREVRNRLGSAAGPRQVAELDERAGILQAQAPRLVRSAGLLREIGEAFNAVREYDLKPYADLAAELAGLRERMRGAVDRSFEGREADGRIADLEGILRDLKDWSGKAALRLQAPPAQATPVPSSVPAPAAAASPVPPRPASAVPRIRKGFEAFFKGDLDAAGAAARDLSSLGADHPYASLLRGVVAWTRYAAGGGVDAAQGREAAEAFAAAKQAGLQSGDLPTALFSPKLIAFFQQAR